MVGPPPPSWAVDAGAVRAFELAPGLWQLRLPTPWEHMSHVNAYAVDRADGGIVLVDAGCAGHPSAWETLERGLALTGRAIADVGDIVVTHYHSDHMGLAGPLAAASGATVWAHPDHAHLFDAIHEPHVVYEQRRSFARDNGVPAEWQDAVASVSEELDGVVEGPEPDRELVDGVVVPSALGPLEVLETPGHAPTHVCLYARERGLLFAGDLVSPIFTTYGDWGYSDDPTGDYRASVDRIAALEITLGLPGHGRPTPEFGALLALYQEGFAERLAAVRASAAPTIWDIALDVFGEPELPYMTVWNFYEAAGYLRHLERITAARGATDR